jgi:soluble lytic murein transglycosylase-like protein
LTKVKKQRVATTKKQRVATIKKQRVAMVKKPRVATLKKTRIAKLAKSKYRVANLRKHRATKTYARLHRAGKNRHYARHERRNPAIIAAVKAHARSAGVPVSVALAVVRQESGFNPRATGSVGEIGLMQLKCTTARGMGYRGSCRGLYDVSTNLRFGMRYLRMALNRGSVGFYNAGVGAKRLPHAARRYAAAVHRKRRNV